MKSLLEMLDPQGFASQFGNVRATERTPIPAIPMPGLSAWERPDYADVILMDNEGAEDVRDSVLLAEEVGDLPRMDYGRTLP